MTNSKPHGIKTAVFILGIMSLLSLTSLVLPPGAQAYNFQVEDSVSASAGVLSGSTYEGIYEENTFAPVPYDGRQFISKQAAGSGKFPYFYGHTLADGYKKYSGSAKAAADAATGSLKVWGQADGEIWVPNPPPGGTSSPGDCMATGYANLRDSLYLNWPTTRTTPFLFTIHWNVSGSFHSTSPDAYAWTSLAVSPGDWYPYFVDLGTKSLKSGSAAYTYSFTVYPSNPKYHYLGLYAQLEAGAIMGTASFYNTGVFSLEMPPDVTFESSSGVFLTQTPLPGALVLFGSGLAGLLLLRQSRRRP